LTALIRQTVVRPMVIEPRHIGEGAKLALRRSCGRRLAITHAAVIITPVAIARFARFGTDPATSSPEVLVYSSTAASLVLIIAWFGSLVLSRNREPRVVGYGRARCHTPAGDLSGCETDSRCHKVRICTPRTTVVLNSRFCESNPSSIVMLNLLCLASSGGSGQGTSDRYLGGTVG
jgi:hypothetical protein